jgi:multidrug efflux pump subunit AcrB
VRDLLPASSRLVVVQDSSPFVRSSLLGIEEELVTAVILTSLVVLAFLHNPRAAVIVLFSIPTTLLTTFIAMRLLGFSLSFLSTLGLTLTIGILVDDSIVVLENTLRHLGRGEPPAAAALLGRSEIGLAAVAITLVDAVVFAPTGLVSGQIGSFFREFGFTIAAATLTSLLVSFTLTPMLAARFLEPEDEGAHGGVLGRFGRWWDRGFGRRAARAARGRGAGRVISSTLLILVLVPVMYTLLDGLPTALGRRLAALVRLGRRRSPVLMPGQDGARVAPTAIDSTAAAAWTNGTAEQAAEWQPTRHAGRR